MTYRGVIAAVVLDELELLAVGCCARWLLASRGLALHAFVTAFLGGERPREKKREGEREEAIQRARESERATEREGGRGERGGMRGRGGGRERDEKGVTEGVAIKNTLS